MKILSNEVMPFIKEMLDLNKSVEFRVSGNSMLPFFRHHETIVHLNKKNKYRKNDVILYLKNNTYVLHRIYKERNGYFIVYGDALKTKEIVLPNDILGYVDYYSNKNKKIYSNSKSYKIRVKIWKTLKPIRKILLFIMKKVKLI